MNEAEHGSRLAVRVPVIAGRSFLYNYHDFFDMKQHFLKYFPWSECIPSVRSVNLDALEYSEYFNTVP